jgi:hypothetical protein
MCRLGTEELFIEETSSRRVEWGREKKPGIKILRLARGVESSHR